MMLKRNWKIIGSGLSLAFLAACAGDDGTTGESETMTATTTTEGTSISESTASSTSTDPTTGTTDNPTGTETMGMTTMGPDPTTTETTGPEPFCGDGNLDDGEECDDGEANGTEESMCNEDCTLGDAVCGNGVVETGEDCDDGNNEDGDGCDSECNTEDMPAECGNGVQEEDEECDDGNDMDDDGCNNDCTISPSECGDGIVQEWVEECDDGNDVPLDGCENDCTVTPPIECVPLEDYISCDTFPLDKNDPESPFKAIGLGCSDDPTESIIITETSFNSPNADAWQIISNYGNMGIWPAQEGESYVIMGSGTFAAPQDDGTLILPNNSQVSSGNNNNPDDDEFLPGYTPADDDSGALGPQWMIGNSNPNDKIWWSFKTSAPALTEGYTISFAFFSSEWPVYVDTTFNDLLVVWVVEEMFTGSISVIDGLSTTITALHPHWSDVPIGFPKTCANFGEAGPGYSCTEPELQGTGYETHAATGWATINRPIEAETDLEMFFFLADMGDSILATAATIDNFRWVCEECIPEDDPLCTGEVPDPNCCGVILPE